MHITLDGFKNFSLIYFMEEVKKEIRRDRLGVITDRYINHM